MSGRAKVKVELWVLGCVLCLAFGFVSRAAAQECAVIYEHKDFGGSSRAVAAGEAVAWIGDDWNDQMSSARVSAGCTLVVYEHANFKGASEKYRKDKKWVGDAWNDQVSGYRCTCDAPAAKEACATVYEHSNYEGKSRKVKEGEITDWVGDAWNDQISSVKVHPGCSFTASEHARFEGESITYSHNTSWVGDPWNDKISAYGCVCGE
jgi:hypothetical protein